MTDTKTEDKSAAEWARELFTPPPGVEWDCDTRIIERILEQGRREGAEAYIRSRNPGVACLDSEWTTSKGE